MSKRWVGFLVLALGLAISGASVAKPKPKAAAAAPLRIARANTPPATAKSVEVLWGGSWWAASVLETKNGLTKIHYTGWGNEWDEWVDATRLRSSVRAALSNPTAGQKIEVEWHGSWWAAEILETRSGFSKIHYTGWGSEWDEWVEANRMRTVSAR